MTIKNYLKRNLSNCLLNNEPIDFDAFYKEYLYLKEEAGILAKEYNIKIKVTEKGIIVPKEDSIKSIINNSNLVNFVSIDEDANIAHFTLIQAITYTLKKIAYKAKYYKKNIDLDFTFVEAADSITHENFILFIPEMVNSYGEKNNLYNISESLKNSSKNITLDNKFNYKDKGSLWFHTFIAEIVYYSYEIESGSGQPKICPDCHEPHFCHSKLCYECNKKRKNERRKANFKCERLRNKLRHNLQKYYNLIPKETYQKVNEMLIKDEHKYTDLKKLKELDIIVENVLKK